MNAYVTYDSIEMTPKMYRLYLSIKNTLKGCHYQLTNIAKKKFNKRKLRNMESSCKKIKLVDFCVQKMNDMVMKEVNNDRRISDEHNGLVKSVLAEVLVRHGAREINVRNKIITMLIEKQTPLVQSTKDFFKNQINVDEEIYELLEESYKKSKENQVQRNEACEEINRKMIDS